MESGFQGYSTDYDEAAHSHATKKNPNKPSNGTYADK